MNSIISCLGGKKALRELIYQRMPKEFGRYIEVFGGGGWVLFGRPMNTAMEVYNDFNSDLANLFKCAKEQTFDLIRELNFLPLNSRDEFSVLRRYLSKKEFTSEYLSKELDLAKRHLPPPDYEDIYELVDDNSFF
jgi:DNA adenine methylase